MVLNRAYDELVRENLQKGRVEGRVEGIEKSILVVLQARGLPVSATARARIESCRDTAVAERWLQRAVVVGTVDEVFLEV